MPGGFGLQAAGAFSTGVVMAQVYDKNSREEERKGNADSKNNKERFFP
jgi:hypothetical protein